MFKMRSVAALALAFLAASLAPALSQSAVSPSTMISEINTRMPNNTTGLITPATQRGVLSDMVNNFGLWGIDKTFNPWHLCVWWNAVNCSTVGRIDPITGMVTVSASSLNIAYVANSNVICDGSSDANIGGVLQAVVDAAAAARQELYWPPLSDCHIKTYLSVPAYADWRGFATTISLDAAITTGGTLGVGMSLENVSNVHWNGITFSGAGSASINNHARIVGVNVSNSSITNSTFQNFGFQQNFTGTVANGSNIVTSVSSVAGLKVGMQLNLIGAILGKITVIGANTLTMDANSDTSATGAAMWGNFYAQGFQSFVPTNLRVENSLFQNNSGDGLSYSNNVQGVRIINNRFINNNDSAFVLCTIGGSDNQAIGNTVISPSNNSNPPIVSERCQNSIIARNTVSSPPGTNAIRIARYGDTFDINQDIKITENTVTGGGNISVENAGFNQGSVSVPWGGKFTVSDNHVSDASGAGIALTDSTNGTVTGNVITDPGGEGIIEESFVAAVGNNTITGNVIEGATYCLRQLNSGGSIIKSQYTGNQVALCSVTPTQFVSADYLDRGSISGSAPAGLLSGATLAANVINSSLVNFGASPTLTTPILTGGFASLSGVTSGTLFVAWPATASGTMSFQNGTDTIVARATTDTLTNKTISGASNTLSNVALSSLASEAANTIVANGTAGSASPTALAMPSCSTSGSALLWTTSGGASAVTCNTAINAATLGGASFAAPGPIGSGTPGTGAFTTVSATGQFTSTLATGTAPFSVASTTQVSNLFATKAATANAWTTARNLAGNSVDGSANVAFANKFIVQGTTDAGLSGAQFLGALGTGLVKNTTTTGVLSIASAGTDYLTSVGASFTGGLISVGSSPLTANGTLAFTVAGTSGGIPYFASTSTWASSALLASNAIMLGGGAGNPPATTTTGTGVVTALGVNVGSAGAFVVNGGALGTPSSGTLSSATGLPISTGVSGLGTGIATALAVNTGSAGAPVLFNGAGGTPSSLTLTNATALPAASVSSGALVNGMTATTQTNLDNSTKIATTGYVDLAMTSYTPVASCSGTGSITTTSTSGQWVQHGKLLYVEGTLAVSALSCQFGVFVTLPNSLNAASNATSIIGKDASVSKLMSWSGSTGSNTLFGVRYDNTVPTAGNNLLFSGSLSVQ